MSQDHTSENKSSLPTWKCEFEDVTEFTVGDKKKLTCHGEYIERILEPILIVPSRKEMKWTLYPLELISAENENVTLRVTSYQPGQFSNFRFVVMGKNGAGFEVESLNWKVQSVIKQNEKGFGPSQPIHLNWPDWFWGGWGLALAWVVMIVMYQWIKGLKRKKIIRNLSTHKTFRSPYNQYHWEMRKLAREYQTSHYIDKVKGTGSASEYLLALDKTLRLYLVRQLKVPALNWKSHQVFKEIKDHHKLVFQSVGLDIQKTLREFEKAMEHKESINIEDCYQFHQMSRNVVEMIEEEG